MRAVLLALLAAACLASATVLQHRAASVAGRSGLVGLRADPGWLLGLLLGGAGVLAHALALGSGAVAVVQPLLLLGVAAALPLAVLVEHRRPRASESWAGIALVVGLACALLSAAPTTGAARGDLRPLLTGSGLAVVGCVSFSALAAVALRHRAALLGAAGGIATGLAGVLLKQGVGAGLHPLPLLASAAAGLAGLVLTTRAYASGPLASSLPALAAAEPAVAVLLGTRAFGEHLAAGAFPRAGQLLGCAVVLAAVRSLARTARQSGARRELHPAR